MSLIGNPGNKERNLSMPTTFQRPNVIYILADDMGYGDVRYLNPQCKFPTPHLDRLGREGVAFRDAHSSSSVCTPSRYSIMTGRYCWRTYLKKGVLGGTSDSLLEPDRKTVANFFKDDGYVTGCVGKWHLGWEWAAKEGSVPVRSDPDWWKSDMEWIDYSKPIKKGPCDFGFDSFFGISGSLDMAPYVYVENDMPVGVPTCWGSAKEFVREGPRLHNLRANNVLGNLTDKAVDFIHHQTADQPFFLYFPLTAPHTPIAPSPEFDGKSGINPYADFCMEVDARVGQVLDALDHMGFADDTMVVFTTDNGCSRVPAEADFLEKRYGHRCSHIYRGFKSDIWDGGHRLPFLVRWPNGANPGSFCDETTGLFDFAATIADLLGRETSDDECEDSVSFLPALRGGAIDANGREALVHHSISGMFAMRRDKWKLCFCPGSGGWSSPTDKDAVEDGAGEFQLYDLDNDPGEENNLFGSQPDVEKALLDLLRSYVLKGRSTNGATQENDPTVPLEEWTQLSFLPDMPERFVKDD